MNSKEESNLLKQRNKMDQEFNTIDRIFAEQRNYFDSHFTKSVSFRINALKKLKRNIEAREKEIAEALYNDLKKSFEESYLSEISIVLQEIKIHLEHLTKWAKPKRVTTPMQLLPSSSFIEYQPLGVTLIMSPWNYPFQLVMVPLVNAISSGCCSILKPSEFNHETARILDSIIKETFEEQHIAIVHGNHTVAQHLLQKPFDLIFFTGSAAVGKIVLKAAAENLTPVILELGGKNPCIVDKSANLTIAANRIAWAKGMNSGQTCIAPDYILAEESIKPKLLQEIKKSFHKMYGEDIQRSKYYPRIIHETAFNRLSGLLREASIYSGGETDQSELYIEPAILDKVSFDDVIMQEEIFGPLLPVISFKDLTEAIDQINRGEKPLVIYYFGDQESGRRVIAETTSGGICINDTLIHLANHHLPFGGVGKSGNGKYHGKYGFEAFSHARAIVKTPNWADLPFRYPPFKYFKWIRRII
jgi:aldehyde dehydrogenase (NAD+)